MQQSTSFIEEDQDNAGEAIWKHKFCIITNKIAENIVNICKFFDHKKVQEKRVNINCEES